jgi:hypothetical protein
MNQRKGLIAGLACLLASLLPAWPAAAQPGPPRSAGSPLHALATQVDANTAAIETLQSKTTLSDLPCSHDQIARFDGTNWVCAADPTALFESLNNAICVKADQDHDSIRPLTCDARCDCFQEALALGPLTACAETAPGSFDATVVDTRARCIALSPVGTGGGCEASSLAACGCEQCTSQFGTLYACNCSACPQGEGCLTPYMLGGSGVCATPCHSDGECPLADIPVTLSLSGVSTPGSTQVAHCACSGTDCPERDINSVDAQACLAEFESTLGASCTQLPASSQ